MTNQSTDTIKVQLGESVSLLGSPIGIWVRGYLEEQKPPKDSRTIKAHLTWVTVYQSWETWSTLHSLQAAQ